MIDIIIVNYFSVDKILNVLKTVFASAFDSGSINVIIISNSNENELTDISSLYSCVTLVINKENIGFGKACNIALAYCRSKYVLLLNPDTELSPTTLPACIDYMDQHTDITVMGVKHVNEKGKVAPSCSRFFTLKNHLNHVLGLSKISPRMFKHSTVMKDYDYSQSGYVDQVMGAFMMVQRSFIDKYGFMDERFFVFGEDMDFCKKVWSSNGKVYYNAAIQIMHESGGSTANITGKRICFAQEGRLKYANKYFNRLEYYVLLFTIIFIEPFTRLLFAAAKGNFSGVKETVNAYILFWKRRQFR